MYQIIRFFKGHLQILIHGPSKERFLNLCRNHHIFLWKIEFQNEKDNFKAYVSISDYFRLLPILRKTETHATVQEKHGFLFLKPLLIQKLVLFIVLFFIFAYLMHASCYIWAFSIVGNQSVTNDQFHDFLITHQVHIGMKKNDLEIEELELQCRDTFPQITWISMEIHGTHCMISIQENQHLKEKSESESYADIIAGKEGQIVSIITRHGVPIVKKGDFVEKDTILVKGNVPVFNEEGDVVKEQYYKADADILIKTKEHFSSKIEKHYVEKVFTNEYAEAYQYQLEHFSFTLPAHLPIKHILHSYQKNGYKAFLHPQYFEHAVRYTDHKQMKLFTHFYLPVYRTKIMQKEYLCEEKEYSDSELEMMLTEQVNKFILCLQEKGVQIMEKDVKIKKNISFSEVIADFVTIESAGIYENQLKGVE